MNTIKRALFAGGCFWCMVKPFDEYPGIIKLVVGYTGGDESNPTYEAVCNHETGHQEALEITYDEALIEYEELVEIFFRSIDPTDPDGQFHDRGRTYQTAIYYLDEEQKQVATTYKEKLAASGVFDKPIVVPIRPAKVFYPAEEYHQDYYKKNALHYQLYYKGSGRKAFVEDKWYRNPYNQEVLKGRLSSLAYKVTQENATEPPYQNPYYNQKKEGIYVDVVSGKPLFSSKDQYDSGCGWPAFTKPIVPSSIYEKRDLSHGMDRIEVRSSRADSHLGHVFDDGPDQTGGLRYCINSAALDFIPKDEMESKGYGNYLKYL